MATLDLYSPSSHDVDIISLLAAAITQVKYGTCFSSHQEFRETLPSWKTREEVVRLVRGNQVCVISGETGCGKTTQVMCQQRFMYACHSVDL